jgi:hypothetical protein
MSISNQTIDFAALSYALAQQEEPLPESLQYSLTEISQSLSGNRADSLRQMRELVQQYLPLETAYKEALDRSVSSEDVLFEIMSSCRDYTNTYQTKYSKSILFTLNPKTVNLLNQGTIIAGQESPEVLVEQLRKHREILSGQLELLNRMSDSLSNHTFKERRLPQIWEYENSLQDSSKSWDKTDRIAVMTAGGIALGAAIAQLPGAIIGGIFAAGYGWYISFGKTKSSRNS